jgi:hypothetical protein
MSRPLFLPSLRQAAWLAAIGVAALGCAYYVRYHLVEQPAVGIACQTGPSSLICAVRGAAIALFTPSVFGIVALVGAVLNLIRPGVLLVALALAAAGLGVVLYNASLSALAVALLVLSLARPAPEPE